MTARGTWTLACLAVLAAGIYVFMFRGPHRVEEPLAWCVASAALSVLTFAAATRRARVTGRSVIATRKRLARAIGCLAVSMPLATLLLFSLVLRPCTQTVAINVIAAGMGLALGIVVGTGGVISRVPRLARGDAAELRNGVDD